MISFSCSVCATSIAPIEPTIAVVVAAFGNGVDVGAEHERRELRVAAGSAADDVPGGVDRDVQIRVLHQSEHVFTALLIGVAVSNAADAALRIRAKLREPFDVLHDSLAVDAQRRLKMDAAKRQRAKAEGETIGEFATVERHCFLETLRDQE